MAVCEKTRSNGLRMSRCVLLARRVGKTRLDYFNVGDVALIDALILRLGSVSQVHRHAVGPLAFRLLVMMV